MNTPKPVVDAIFPDAVTVGGYTLRPLSLSNMILLEKVDSPFVRSPEEKAGSDARPPDALDVVRALYILTRTTDELQSLYEGFDRPKFEHAVWTFGDSLPAGLANSLMPKFIAIFNAATSTLIGGGAGEDNGGDDGKKKIKALKTSARRASRPGTGGL